MFRLNPKLSFRLPDIDLLFRYLKERTAWKKYSRFILERNSKTDRSFRLLFERVHVLFDSKRDFLGRLISTVVINEFAVGIDQVHDDGMIDDVIVANLWTLAEVDR